MISEQKERNRRKKETEGNEKKKREEGNWKGVEERFGNGKVGIFVCGQFTGVLCSGVSTHGDNDEYHQLVRP